MSQPSIKKTFFISGPVGQQEIVTATPEKARNITCVICHPHPVHGGTMHNKVVYTLASAMDVLKIKTVRFNFRGVQKSEGNFDEGVGELEDLLSVVQWVKACSPNDEIWLAGFSFGAHIAIKGHQECKAKQLIAVAPPVGQPYFQDMPMIICPWILVQGDQDEIIDAAKVLTWAKEQYPAPDMILLQEAGHFFHGRLTEVKERLINALDAVL